MQKEGIVNTLSKVWSTEAIVSSKHGTIERQIGNRKIDGWEILSFPVIFF